MLAVIYLDPFGPPQKIGFRICTEYGARIGHVITAETAGGESLRTGCTVIEA